MNFRRSHKSKVRKPKAKRIFAIIADTRAPDGVGVGRRCRTLRQAYTWAQGWLNNDIKRNLALHHEVMILKTVDIVQAPNGHYRPRRIR